MDPCRPTIDCNMMMMMMMRVSVYCRLLIVQRFSDDQIDCMCEALLQQYPGSRSRLAMLVSSLSSSQLQRADSEHLLRARAVVAFHTGHFTELYAILTGSHVFHPAHHPLLQKVTHNTHNLLVHSDSRLESINVVLGLQRTRSLQFASP